MLKGRHLAIIALSVGASAPALAQAFDYNFSANTAGGLSGTQSGSVSLFYNVATSSYTLTGVNYSNGSTVFSLTNTGLSQFGSYVIIGGLQTGIGGDSSGTDDFYLQLLKGPGIGVFSADAFTYSTSATQSFGYAGPAWGALSAGSSLTVLDITSPVPEPGSWALLLLGFGAIGCASRSKRSARLLRRQHAPS